MKFFPLVTAVLVTVILFFAVLQRDVLFNFAGRDTDAVAAPEGVEPQPQQTVAKTNSSTAEAGGIAVMALSLIHISEPTRPY